MKKRLVFVIVLSVAALTFIGRMLAAPGGEDDPVVTLSYIEQVLMPSVTEQIQKEAAPVFNVMDVEAGSSVICAAGAEIILRKGSATVIATEKGGLANVTSGVDLQSGANVPANSLLIVPLSDGRGIAATSDVILMIKGGCTILKAQN